MPLLTQKSCICSDTNYLVLPERRPPGQGDSLQALGFLFHSLDEV